MDALEKSDGIMLRATLTGYDSLSSVNKQKIDSLEDHPGFKKIIELLNMHSDDVKCWINGDENVYEYRSGALWRYINTTDPKKMTQTQLANIVTTWAPMIKEYEEMKKADALAMGEMAMSSSAAPKPKVPTTRTILHSYRKNHAARDIMKRVIKAEKKLNENEMDKIPDNSGEIYAAWNELMELLFKLGFTYRDAETRVKELQTAGVLEAFHLVRRARVPDARRYEKAMHYYFKEVRVYKRKEFFAVSAEEINVFFDIVEGKSDAAEHMEERKQWEEALAKAGAKK